MPAYDYECSEGHQVEVRQGIKEEPIKECPKCGAPCRRVILETGGFILKGGGWSGQNYSR